MDQKVLAVIALLFIIGLISWHRSGKKTVSSVTRQDKLTTKLCIQMALQILSNALEPQPSKSPAAAITAGERALADQGMSCAIVVNVLVMGFLANYAENNQLSSDRRRALMLHASTLLADSLDLSGEELWDRSGELLKENGPLGFLMEKAAKDGVSLPDEVETGS